MDWKRHHTKRYEEYVYQRIKVSSIEQVSREEGLSVEAVKGIFDHISAQKKKHLGCGKATGTEVKLRCVKGIKMSVTVVSDIERGDLLEVIDSHQVRENY